MKKVFKLILVSGLVASSALCADIAKDAKTLADKQFKLNKDASALMAKMHELCKEQENLSKQKAELTKDLTPEQLKEFGKEYKYAQRQNVAKLAKDEPYFEGICKMGAKAGKRAKGMNAPQGKNPPCQEGQECPAPKKAPKK